MSKTVFEGLMRLKSLAQIGLNFKNTPYDEERHGEMLQLADSLLAGLTDIPLQRLRVLNKGEVNYITPKVDVRCLVRRDGDILLIKERADGLWALPGGWADIGFTPSEVAVKEVREETGQDVEVDHLLAVFDNHSHGHPPSPFHIYKMFFSCRVTGGDISKKGYEALEAGYFPPDRLPPLSQERNTATQIERLVKSASASDLPPTLFD